jgi:hypothetical protein
MNFDVGNLILGSCNKTSNFRSLIPWAKYTTSTVAQAKQNKILPDQTQIFRTLLFQKILVSLFDAPLLSICRSPIDIILK